MYSLASVMPGNSGDSAAGVIGRWKISIRGLRCCCEKRQREASGSFSRTLLFICSVAFRTECKGANC